MLTTQQMVDMMMMLEAQPTAPPKPQQAGFMTQVGRGLVSGATLGAYKPFEDAGEGGWPETISSIVGAAAPFSAGTRLAGLGMAGMAGARAATGSRLFPNFLNPAKSSVPGFVSPTLNVTGPEVAVPLGRQAAQAAGQMLTRRPDDVFSMGGRMLQLGGAGVGMGVAEDAIREAKGEPERGFGEKLVSYGLSGGVGALIGRFTGGRRTTATVAGTGTSTVGREVTEEAAAASGNGMRYFQGEVGAAAQGTVERTRSEIARLQSALDQTPVSRATHGVRSELQNLIRRMEEDLGPMEAQAARISPEAAAGIAAEGAIPQITPVMRMRLRNLGYPEDAVNSMPPAEASAILRNGVAYGFHGPIPPTAMGGAAMPPGTGAARGIEMMAQPIADPLASMPPFIRAMSDDQVRMLLRSYGYATPDMAPIQMRRMLSDVISRRGIASSATSGPPLQPPQVGPMGPEGQLQQYIAPGSKAPQIRGVAPVGEWKGNVPPNVVSYTRNAPELLVPPGRTLKGPEDITIPNIGRRPEGLQKGAYWQRLKDAGEKPVPLAERFRMAVPPSEWTIKQVDDAGRWIVDGKASRLPPSLGEATRIQAKIAFPDIRHTGPC